MAVRAARVSDLEVILDIYNHAVVNSTATFDMAPRSLEAQEAWFTAHVPPHPLIVWDQEGRVLGWGSIGSYSDRPGYRFTGELSVYVRDDARRRGIGEALLRELIGLGASNGLHALMGRICVENEASCRLAEKTGFRSIGVMAQVGYKFDRWLDVAIYQYRLDT